MYGERIQQLRTEKGYTQDTLGERLGVANKTIGSWEREARKPPVDKITEMAKLFDVSTDYLLGTSDKRHYYSLTEKDDKAIDAELERIIGGLTDKSGVSFLKNDATLSDNDRALLAASLRSSLALAHEMAKKKFTPKKYRGSEKDAD